VTITTTPKTSPVQHSSKDSPGSPPPAKIARNHSSGSSSGARGESPHKSHHYKEKADKESTSASTPTSSKLKDERSKSPAKTSERKHSTSTTSASSNHPGSPVGGTTPSISNGSSSTAPGAPAGKGRSLSFNREENNNFNNNHLHTHQEENNNALPVEYWRNRQPLADQIVITDVTVMDMTVTIRECKTQAGFFKEREEAELRERNAKLEKEAMEAANKVSSASTCSVSGGNNQNGSGFTTPQQQPSSTVVGLSSAK
jgi:hypothetical protein